MHLLGAFVFSLKIYFVIKYVKCSQRVNTARKIEVVFIPAQVPLNLVVLLTSFLRKSAASRATAAYKLSKWLKLSAPREPCNTYTWIILFRVSQGYLYWLAQASYSQPQTLLSDILTTRCSLLKLWNSFAFMYHARKYFVYPISSRNKVSTLGMACSHAPHSRVHILPLLLIWRLAIWLLENFIEEV